MRMFLLCLPLTLELEGVVCVVCVFGVWTFSGQLRSRLIGAFLSIYLSSLQLRPNNNKSTMSPHYTKASGIRVPALHLHFID